MFTSLRVNKVEFTLSQCTICYDMSLITLLSHLLGAFEGFQNYNLIKINTKHASYKTGSRKKIILSAQCHRAFNTCVFKHFRLAQLKQSYHPFRASRKCNHVSSQHFCNTKKVKGTKVQGVIMDDIEMNNLTHLELLVNSNTI